MNYSDFKEQIVKVLKRIYPEKIITTEKVTKNNETVLDGLIIRGKEESVSPVIYLNDFFDSFEKGQTLAAITEDLYTIIQENKDNAMVNVADVKDFEKMKSRVSLKLINYEKNKMMLKDTPHKRFLDLAIVFCCVLKDETYGMSSMIIQNGLAEAWGIEEKTLFELAEKNTLELLGYEIVNLSELMKQMSNDLAVEVEAEPGPALPMEVITNEEKWHGAANILFDNVLQECTERMGDNFFILPSSVHELIMIPESEVDDAAVLREMVRGINQCYVDSRDFLSDEIYYCDKESKEIRIYK